MPWKSALPMYTLGDADAANALLWSAIVARLVARGVQDVPDRLEHPQDLDGLWRHPDLLLAQTCGYPLRTRLRDAVQLVGTPLYSAEGCVGSSYRSAIVVPTESGFRSLLDIRGRVASVNAFDSHSGMNAFRATIADVAGGTHFFGSVIESGSHERSLELVGSGEADCAAIDCVTLGLVARFRPDLRARVRILCWTMAAPTLPFITSRRTGSWTLAQLRAALQQVAVDPDLREVRQALLLTGFTVLPLEAYTVIDRTEAHARTQGYSMLA